MFMDYTLHQLHIFLKVAQKQSVTRAAEELFLTQPAVSIQLRKFQDQFSIPLTEVIGRQLYITEFGKEIALAAENILDQVHAINYKTLSYQGAPVGRLKISVVSTGKYVMPYFLADFMHQNAGIELMMDVTNKRKVVRSLEENKMDFALVSVVPEKLEIERIELMANKLFLVGGTRLKSARPSNQRKIFETMPLIFREEGSATRNAMEGFITKHKLPIRRKIQLTSNEAVKQAVIAGLGYSIMPLIGIKYELKNQDLEIIPIKGLPISTTWNLIWLQAKNLSPAASFFVKYLQEEKEKIIQKSFEWFLEY
jgi:DNA-binding transcriptional LysR family regulator